MSKKIEELFQRAHKILDKYDLTQPDEPANELKGIISMLQVEVYKRL